MATLKHNALSKKLKQSFLIEQNTLKRTVKDSPNDRIEIEVGDSKQPDFKPQLKFMRWDNEVNFSLRAQEDPDATIATVDDKVIYKARNYEVHQYEKPEASDDGGYEFEWVLPSKPDTNVLTATIQTKGLDFFYQGELTPEEIAEGDHRPENVVGSYAVYHKTKRDNFIGGKEYKTGKAFHIYRPKAIDSQGAEVWCDLHIDEDKGLLTVTVPQEFLDSAVYPIIVDPTFGYTTLGGTSTSNTTVHINEHSLVEAATVESLSIGLTPGSTSMNYKAAIFNNDGTRTLITYVERTALGSTSKAFYDFDISDQALSVDGYYIGGRSDTSSSIWYDAGTNNWRYNFSNSGSYSYSGFPPAAFSSSSGSGSNRIYSVYATYGNFPSVDGSITSVINNTTLSHTTTSDTDMLVVAVGVHQGTISNVQFDGVSLTKAVDSATAFNETAEIWYLTNPGAKTANITLTRSGGSAPAIVGINVKDAKTSGWTPTTAETTSSGDPVSLDITTPAADCLVISAAYSEADFTTLQTTAHTSAANLQANSYENFAVTYGKIVSSTLTTIRWDLDSGQRTAFAAVAVEYDAGGAVTSVKDIMGYGYIPFAR